MSPINRDITFSHNFQFRHYSFRPNDGQSLQLVHFFTCLNYNDTRIEAEDCLNKNPRKSK
jgi:hypothetical protein